MEKEALFESRSLSLSFRMYDGGLAQRELRVISDLSLKVYGGEILAIVGSSGAGKSLLASAILGILPENATLTGELLYRGEPLDAKKQKKLCGREIALVPQSVAYLDPTMKVGAQADGHRKPKPTEKRRRLFERFSLPARTESMYPHELSGGMARRVLVTTALLTDASLVIADEPTPGMSLDQAKAALASFREMADAGKAVILITHDIDLAVEFADRVAVLYAGTVLESAPAADFKVGIGALRHPYSEALWRALPQNGFEPIAGAQPYAGDLQGEDAPRGCLFAPRCPHASARCFAEGPPVREVRGGEVRCYRGT